MRFKKNAIAICVGSALILGNAVAQTQTDSRSAFGQQEQTSAQYVIYLEDDAALKNHVKGKHNYGVEKEKITVKQNALFAQIQALDPMAKIVTRSSMLANFVTVSMSSEYAEKLIQLDGVKTVRKTTASHNIAAPKVSVSSTAINNTEASAVEMMAPYTASETAGEGIDVAIISTGIDYTLAAFGGSGEYGEDNDPETPPAAGSYLDALENGALSPSTPEIPDDPDTEEDEYVAAVDGYDGFPTEVIVGGRDFASENWGEDGNPIDQNFSAADWTGWEYPTGQGTELASIVHQLAPGAKLHAYKVSNISPYSWDETQYSITAPDSSKIVAALEHALDPNQDGDTSDHVDIVLMDSAGAAGFFDPTAIGGSGAMFVTKFILDKAAAHGMTIVTPAGTAGAHGLQGGEVENRNRYWISTEGSVTPVLTIGSVVNSDDGESIYAAPWSPMGPVRGSKALKPEIVSFADNQTVAKISSPVADESTLGLRTDALSAAARIAAAAAVVKSNNPALGPVEIKALLANTASHEGILDKAAGAEAELILVGHGVENVDAAINSPVVIWDKSSYQPYVQFGAHEVAAEKSVIKNITIRNLSDSAQTYQISFNMTGEKSSYEALTINMPESVSVPANQSVDIAVEITIDGTKLPEWPLQSAEDFTDENLKTTELNGYLTFTADEKPEINLGWMLKARNETTIEKQVVSESYPIIGSWPEPNIDLDWARAHYGDNEWGGTQYSARTSTFINESLTPTTFEAYPLIINNRYVEVENANSGGHLIRGAGGGIYDDARCEVSGKKMTVAVSLSSPADVSLSNYMDKIGAPIFFYELLREADVVANGWDESFTDTGYWDDSERFAQPFVQINDDGQPATFYVDYSIAYDYTNPEGRYKASVLPTRFSGDGTNIISEVCLEELYHHDIDSVEDFDQNFGFFIETDRDASSESGEGLPQFNPMKGGFFSSGMQCFDGMFGPVCGEVTFDYTTQVGFAEINDDNPVESTDFNHIYTAQPNEEVRIAAAMFDDGLNRVIPEFMVLSTSDNYYETGVVGSIDDDGVSLADVRAGQSFSVDEGAENGTVIGTLKLDTAGFFADGDDNYFEHTLNIVDVLPGTPFAINQETHELYVINSAALDYENISQFQFKVNVSYGNDAGMPQVVTVNLNNVNDQAPEVMPDALAAIPATNVVLEEDSMDFSIDFAGVFVETEGEALTYSVTGSGFSALSVTGTTIQGSVTAAGNYQVTVTASDGINEVSADIPVTVTEAAKDSSSGSIGMFAFLASLLMFRRRK